MDELYVKTPTAIIEDVLSDQENMMDGNTIPRDINSPFAMLMESAVKLSTDALLASEVIIRKKYPDLAIEDKDVFHHITDDLLANMFAVPGHSEFVFWVNTLDVRQYGIREEGNKYVQVSIPETTEITVQNTTFTILNRINIKYFDNGTVSVEQLASDLDMAVNEIGMLRSGITADTSGTEWIVFSTKIKNISKTTTSTAVLPSKKTSLSIPLKNKFASCLVYYNTTEGIKEMSVSFSESYMDPSKPTAFINLESDKVNVVIPEVYNINGLVTGTVIVDVYETKGKHYLPLNKLDAKEFGIKFNNSDKDKYTAVMPDVITMVQSRTILDGGRDNITFDKLKESIINNTLGDIDLPISLPQLSAKAGMYGYELHEAKRTLSNSLYVATKDLRVSENALILAEHDVFFNTVEVNLEDDIDKNGLYRYENNFVIKADSLFKYDNGKVKLLTKYEKEYINSLDRVSKMSYLKENRIYYTPYEYVLMYKDNITTSEVYYFNPSILSNRIIAKNSNIEPSVNIDKYRVDKTESGYKLMFTIIANQALEATDLNKLKMRLVAPLSESNNLTVYFDSRYNQSTGRFEFDIDSSFISDGKIIVDNGTSKLYDKRVDILTTSTIFLYSEDSNIDNSTKFLHEDNLFELDTDKHITILSKETIEVEFANKIDYLYNNVYNTYTERKYLKHQHDVPAFYTENVYEEQEDGSIIDATLRSDGKVNLVANIIHKEGDPILDSDGNQIYHAREGDIVYEGGEPVIDKMAGVLRFIDILMLEYPFKLVESVSYTKYNELMLDMINHTAISDMSELNDIVLEGDIKFKSNKSSKQVSVSINNVIYSLDYVVKPEVTMYILNTANVTPEVLESYKDTACKVISKHLSKDTIVLREIKDEIMSILGDNVSAINIKNLDPLNSEIIKVISNNKFTLAKRLVNNESNQFIVRYDLDFNRITV